jgi:hypothetical protein
MEIIEYLPGAIAAVALLARLGMAINDSRKSRSRAPHAPL